MAEVIFRVAELHLNIIPSHNLSMFVLCDGSPLRGTLNLTRIQAVGTTDSYFFFFLMHSDTANMAPTTRSMCVRTGRSTEATKTVNRAKKQTVKVPTRTPSRRSCKRQISDKSTRNYSSKTDDGDEKEDIFQADLLPEWVLVHIFSFLTVKEKCRLTW